MCSNHDFVCGISRGHQEWQQLLSLFVTYARTKEDTLWAEYLGSDKTIATLKAKIPHLRRDQFAHQMVRQLNSVDEVEQRIKTIEEAIEQEIQRQEALVRNAQQNVKFTASLSFQAFLAYVKWAKEMIDSFHVETVQFNKAIMVMNKTNHYLMVEEKKCLDEIAEYMARAMERLREQQEIMNLSPSYWWYKYSKDKDMKDTWNLERKKKFRREEIAKQDAIRKAREELEMQHKKRDEEEAYLAKEKEDLATLVTETAEARNELREKQRDLRWLERYGRNHKEKIQTNLDDIKMRQRELKEDMIQFQSLPPLPPLEEVKPTTKAGHEVALDEEVWKGGDAFASDSESDAEEAAPEQIQEEEVKPNDPAKPDGEEEAVETAQESDDEDSLDSHDLVEGDFEDLTYEMVFLPLWKRRQILHERRGVEEVVEEKSIKIWTSARRKEVRRLVKRRTAEQAYEEVHRTLETTQKEAAEIGARLNEIVPTFLSTFEGAAVHSAIAQVGKVMAHTDWKDLPLALKDCRRVVGKIDHAVNLLRDASTKHKGIDEPLILQIEDIGGNVLECLWKLEGVEEAVTRGDVLFIKKNDHGVPDHVRKQFTPSRFNAYRSAYVKHMTKTKDDVEMLNSVNLRKAVADCGRIPVDLEVADLQLLRLYGKQSISFTEFLDYIKRPWEGPRMIQARYVGAIAGRIRDHIGDEMDAVATKVDQIIDGISPARKRARKVFKSAVMIQAYYRGQKVRRAFLASRYYFDHGMSTNSAALRIQNMYWRSRGTMRLEDYVTKEIDKVFDPSTMRCFYVQRSTMHSFVQLPSMLPPAFVDAIQFAKHCRYNERAVLDAIKPDELVKERKEIMRMRIEVKKKHAEAFEKVHATATRNFNTTGEFVLPTVLEQKELEYMIGTLNRLSECTALVRSFAIPSNGLKIARKKFLDVRPEEFDQNNSANSVLL